MTLGLGLNNTDQYTLNMEDFINTDDEIHEEHPTADSKAWAQPPPRFNGVSTAVESNDHSVFSSLFSDQINLLPPL